ncbi:MAG: mechanosensitive ion channel family protein [Armatimonadota bacterium]|nr:mechanosensitive ion channel family protein [Armatimonadota bacterium]
MAAIDVVRETLMQLLSPAALAAAVRSAVVVLSILVGVRMLNNLSRRALERALQPREGARDYAGRAARARTLVPLLHSAFRYVLYFVAAVTILAQLNVHVTAILASAGVVGLAIGFGAQYLIRDTISGFFLILDGAIQVGDVIRVGPDTGQVEQIGIRTTQIRRFTGELVTIPNGEILRFANLNRGYMRAMLTVAVPADADLEGVAAVLAQVGETWAARNPDRALGPVRVEGPMEISGSSATLRLSIPVKPLLHWEAERELRVRVRRALAERGIPLQAIAPSEGAQ